MVNIKKLHQIKLALFLFLFAFLFISHHALAVTATYHLSENKFISYTDEGKGEPLILIHAFPTDKRLWKFQTTGLKEHFRVITLDLWGFGQSSPVNGQAIDMADYADEVKQLLDKLNIQKAIIGGESMGGYVSLAFLGKYPQNVSGLILSNTQSIADSEETKKKREATAINVLKNGSAQLINDFMSKALTPEASNEIRQFLLNILKSQPQTAIASALRGMAKRYDTSHLLSKTELPILIITGEQDALISPQQSLDMHQLAKNSKLVSIINAAHLSNLEQGNEWNQAVIDIFYK